MENDLKKQKRSERIEHQIQKIAYHTDLEHISNFKSENAKKYPYLKKWGDRFLFGLISLLFLIPITYNANQLLDNDNLPLDYEIPKQSIITSNESPEELKADNNPKTDNEIYNIHFKSTLLVHKGSIKEIYLVTSPNSNDMISESDFHLSDKISADTFPNPIRFLLNSFNFSGNKTISTYNLTADLSFSDKDPEKIKPVFIAVVDNLNQIDISLLSIQASSVVSNPLSHSKYSIITTINLNNVFTAADNDFYSSTDILSAQEQNNFKKTKNLLPITARDFKLRKKEIQSILQTYYNSKNPS
jgi:hypothetical protein